MVTLKDIAKITGVSINTVSRALKDKPDIGAETKLRIKQTAETLGYTPNMLARSLASRKSSTIGLIASDLENPVRSILIGALRHTAAKNQNQLLVSGFDNENEIGGCIREMCARGVDGIILGNLGGILSEGAYWPALDAAVSSGIPAVTFYHAITNRIDNVFVDYSIITEDLAKHLIEDHKFRNIKFAAGTLNYERGDGYLRAMKAHGLDRHIGLIPVFGMAESRHGITEYLKNNSAPEAVICHNDLVAIGLIAGLRDCGIRVPENVAVVGIDNVEFAEYMNPSLTTAGICLNTVAEELFGLLVSRIRGEYNGDARQVRLPFRRYVRESCGCVHTAQSKAIQTKQ